MTDCMCRTSPQDIRVSIEGSLWIWTIDGQHTIANSADAMEYLNDLITPETNEEDMERIAWLKRQCHTGSAVK